MRQAPARMDGPSRYLERPATLSSPRTKQEKQKAPDKPGPDLPSTDPRISRERDAYRDQNFASEDTSNL